MPGSLPRPAAALGTMEGCGATIRTWDMVVMSHPLCRLSYPAKLCRLRYPAPLGREPPYVAYRGLPSAKLEALGALGAPTLPRRGPW